jgi:dCTP deaminase
MSILCDTQINELAAKGMIEPFSPTQVKQVDGNRVISYGTSSYGYDIRCAREFKVFTNIHSTVVDPKNFDEKSFVDFEGDYCIIVNVTPFEPEWEGYVTLEFSNTTPLPAKIYAGEGCAQVLFFEASKVCETSYKDRGGKYQGQVGVTLPKT